MNESRQLLEQLKYSPLGRWATLPLRMKSSGAVLLQQASRTMRWIATSKEWANYSTQYSSIGLQGLCANVAWVTGRSPSEVRRFAQELMLDEAFAGQVLQAQRSTRLRHITDSGVTYGKCLANYVLTRACSAHQVFEAGTEQGLSSLAIRQALRRNAAGRPDATIPHRLTTVDIHQDRGLYLGSADPMVRQLIGDSIAALGAEDTPIDLFIHDTVNLPEHTSAQLQAAIPRLSSGGIIHTSWYSPEFQEICEASGLNHLPLFEDIENHWFKGRRAGLAMKP